MRTKEYMLNSIHALDRVVFHLIYYIGIHRTGPAFAVLNDETKYQLNLAMNDALSLYETTMFEPNDCDLTNASYLKHIRAIMRICNYYANS